MVRFHQCAPKARQAGNEEVDGLPRITATMTQSCKLWEWKGLYGVRFHRHPLFVKINAMIERVLIVNRGECARRIAYTVRGLGKTPVMLYTPDDENSLHVKEAEEKYEIASYSDIKGAVKLAQKIGAIIVPGWGFESENPEFPRRCAKEEVLFAGPTEEAMKNAGNKETAKRIAKRLGIPVIESSSRVKRSDGAKWAAKHGLSDQDDSVPMMIKAARAGGGMGNTVVYRLEDIHEAIERLTNRSQISFRKPRIFVERFVEDARHIEVQLLGDQNDNLVHLGTRDCSTQWNNQKLIEEAPASFLTPEQEKLLFEYALEFGRAVGYSNAGTAEFLLSNGNIFFMEFNPRLQVEHGITELITGVDLVEQQIRIAEGKPLEFTQKGIKFSGVAVEARVNAQTIYPSNPKALMPSDGVVEKVIFPEGENIRVDHALNAGEEINLNYNSTQAKVMAWSFGRDEAIKELKEALGQFVIKGVEMNIPFLLAVLSHPTFLNGEHTTNFFEEMLKEMAEKNGGRLKEKEIVAVIGVSLVLALQEGQRQKKVPEGDIWKYFGRMGQLNSGNPRKGWR